jgi:hypothetical protein
MPLSMSSKGTCSGCSPFSEWDPAQDPIGEAQQKVKKQHNHLRSPAVVFRWRLSGNDPRSS